MNFKDLKGKTITQATQKKLKGYDDQGYLLLKFSDGTSTIITASYDGWTGNSVDEYPTNISLEDVGSHELRNA